VVTPQSFANLAPLGGTNTPNRIAAGTGIDGLRGPPGTSLAGDQGAVLSAILGVSPANLGPAFDQIAGAVQGDALVAGASLDRLVTGALPSNRDAAQEIAPLWVRAVGQWIATTGDGNAPGNLDSGGGLVAGYDLIRMPDAVLGIAGGYGVADVATKNAAQAHVETGQVILYAGWTEGALRVDDRVSAGYDHFHSKRLIQVGGLTRTAIGSTDGWSASGDITAHYGDGMVVPFGEFHYDYIGRGAFAETGADALSLNIRSGSLGTLRALVGGDVDLGRLLGGAGWAPAATLAWVHDFGDTAGRTDAALAGAPGTIFSTLSSRTGHDAVLAGLSASKTIDDTFSVFAGYSVEARTRATGHAVSAGLRIQL
jgi:uncharacterized protein with beta-barrel porin domain